MSKLYDAWMRNKKRIVARMACELSLKKLYKISASREIRRLISLCGENNVKEITKVRNLGMYLEKVN